MASESESTDLDRDVDESMRMFERSQVGPAVTITPITPARVLLVLDGSSQDDASTAAAAYLQQRFAVETVVLDARDAADSLDQDLARDRSEQLPQAQAIERAQGDAYDAILAAIDQHDVDLVIVPCPFGRSFQQVGADSAGTVIDVLLSRSSRPLLVIRRDDQRLEQCAGRVSMIVGGECEVEQRAAAWLFGLAAENAEVTLHLVVEKEQYENIRSIVEALQPETSLDPQQFSAALTKTHQRIHAAMSKTAGERGMRYALRPQAGEVAPPNPLEESERMMLVMPLEVDDRFGQGFVQDRIRRSPHPILIVPGHVS